MQTFPVISQQNLLSDGKHPNHQNISREHTDFSSDVTDIFYRNKRGSIFGVLQDPWHLAELDVPGDKYLGKAGVHSLPRGPS